MKNSGSEKIIDHMQGMLVDMKCTARQCLHYQEQGAVPSEHWSRMNEIMAKVNLFWPFWRKQAEAHGADRVALVRLESEMKVIRITLKGIGKDRDIT